MRLRRPFLVLAGVLGGTAILDAFLRRRAGDLEPPLPGEERTYRWRGMDVSYTEAGDPNDPDLVLLHGVNATATSREWAKVFDSLAEDYHVLAPDLPGFGRSDRPPVDYDADMYVDFVRDFADDAAPDATCVASSLTGAYAVLAQRETGVFTRLLLVCPTDTTTSRVSAIGDFLGVPVVGQGAFDALASKVSIRFFAARLGFYDPAAIDEDDVDYMWRSAHQSGARFAPAAFASGRLDPGEDLATALGAIDAPTTLVWGREAVLPPLTEGRDLAETANVRLVVFDRARLLPHVEHPEQFVETVREAAPRARA